MRMNAWFTAMLMTLCITSGAFAAFFEISRGSQSLYVEVTPEKLTINVGNELHTYYRNQRFDSNGGEFVTYHREGTTRQQAENNAADTIYWPTDIRSYPMQHDSDGTRASRVNWNVTILPPFFGTWSRVDNLGDGMVLELKLDGTYTQQSVVGGFRRNVVEGRWRAHKNYELLTLAPNDTTKDVDTYRIEVTRLDPQQLRMTFVDQRHNKPDFSLIQRTQPPTQRPPARRPRKVPR